MNMIEQLIIEERMQDISPEFKYNPRDAKLMSELLKYESTPQAVIKFEELSDKFKTDYAYWFALSTLWVSYTGWSELSLWKRLFSSTRPKRAKCIMKPSEYKRFKQLPYFVTIYRAKRKGEDDWIAYTLDLNIAIRFAIERKVLQVYEYKVKSKDIMALFLRRGEKEVIVLDVNKPVLQKIIKI